MKIEEVINSWRSFIETRKTGRFCFQSMTGAALCFFIFVGSVSVTAADDGYVMLKNGVYCRTADGRMRVEFVSPDIVRVRYTREADFLGNGTIVCVERTENKVPFQVVSRQGELSLQSDSLEVRVDLNTCALTYKDARTGKVLLSERQEMPREAEKTYMENVVYDPDSRRIEKTADGEKEVMDVLRRDTVGWTWKFRNHFRWSEGEALYGLGCHMEDFLDLRGKTMYLCQHNLKEMVPVLNSTAGYGLLFDAGCGMKFQDGAEGGFMELEAAKEVDYYFMKGSTMDRVVAQYRKLTGQSPMMPRYIFGYIQSKERYTHSKELVDVVQEYRRRQVPLDVIVQDWNYWPGGQWGYMKMNRENYPDPRTLADSIHAWDAKLMVSIWPNPTNCPQTKDFERRGFMLPRSVYDAFNPLARARYWEYANGEFFGNGFDAWWCDCTEPLDADWRPMSEGYGWDSHEERWKGNLALLDGVLGAERSSLFSLYHSKGLYENQRATTDRKRVVNLTRSSYAGQQRYSTITWNGDTHASWKSFAQQIPQGLNFMATGCPYWTVDIGSFFTRKGREWFRAGDFDAGVDDMGYREYYVRMLQYGAFLPLFRSHGTDTPREIWRFGRPGEPFYDSILRMIRLRYRLIPYIYSLAGKVTQESYTMSRLLAFDFADDARVHDIKDEFMFGPAFLVCPVTRPMYYDKGSVALQGVEKTRTVYLPEGTDWVDFWSGKKYRGGRDVKADAPIDRIPLFVRQGSIVPMGPVVQHTGELSGKELTIVVYPGRDAIFTLYEDEGDNYGYEQGRFSTIRMEWDDSRGVLSVGQREGSFPSMEESRKFRVVLGGSADEVFREGAGVEVRYDGTATECRL